MRAPEANQRYFREAYQTGKHGWETDEPSPYAIKFLQRLAEVMPCASLLDLGCGEGRHAIAAARLGFRVVAMDLEPLALRRARVRIRAAQVKVRLRQGSALKLASASGAFGVVLDYGCLHHQRKSDWPTYRDSVVQALQPGGFYIVSVFTPDFRLFGGSVRPWHIACGAYRRCFTREDLDEFAAGRFEIIELHEQKPEGFWHVLMQSRSRPPDGTCIC